MANSGDLVEELVTSCGLPLPEELEDLRGELVTSAGVPVVDLEQGNHAGKPDQLNAEEEQMGHESQRPLGKRQGSTDGDHSGEAVADDGTDGRAHAGYLQWVPASLLGD